VNRFIPIMEASGFRIREAVWRLWQGEQDEDALLHGLDQVCATSALSPRPRLRSLSPRPFQFCLVLASPPSPLLFWFSRVKRCFRSTTG
jgi:hypothetical protein